MPDPVYFKMIPSHSNLVNIVTLLSSPAFSEKLIFDDDETVPGI